MKKASPISRAQSAAKSLSPRNETGDSSVSPGRAQSPSVGVGGRRDTLAALISQGSSPTVPDPYGPSGLQSEKLQFAELGEGHQSRLEEHTAALWKYNKITDVTVKLRNRSYPAHKSVLSCYSSYFKDLLLAPNVASPNVINLQLPSITPEAFEVLLIHMYTGELRASCQNIGDVYTAARKLGMKEVLQQCVDILSGKSKKIVNSIYIYVTALKLGMVDASLRAMKSMTKHFEQLVGTQEFLDLNIEQVCELLSAQELATRSEVVVYLAALKWLSVKYLQREKYIECILRCVRFPQMTLNEVLACFSPPLLPAITELPVVEAMLLKAAGYVAAKTVNEEKRFSKYACDPRIYLIEREPLVLWDTNIFDPERYSQYRQELAATTIQAGYRGFKARKSYKTLRRESDAATKIQAGYRGYSTRKRLRSLDEGKHPKTFDFKIPSSPEDQVSGFLATPYSVSEAKRSMISETPSIEEAAPYVSRWAPPPLFPEDLEVYSEPSKAERDRKRLASLSKPSRNETDRRDVSSYSKSSRFESESRDLPSYSKSSRFESESRDLPSYSKSSRIETESRYLPTIGTVSITSMKPTDPRMQKLFRSTSKSLQTLPDSGRRRAVSPLMLERKFEEDTKSHFQYKSYDDHYIGSDTGKSMALDERRSTFPQERKFEEDTKSHFQYKSYDDHYIGSDTGKSMALDERRSTFPQERKFEEDTKSHFQYKSYDDHYIGSDTGKSMALDERRSTFPQERKFEEDTKSHFQYKSYDDHYIGSDTGKSMALDERRSTFPQERKFEEDTKSHFQYKSYDDHYIGSDTGKSMALDERRSTFPQERKLHGKRRATRHSIYIDPEFKNSVMIDFLSPGKAEEERSSSDTNLGGLSDNLHTPVIVILGGFNSDDISDDYSCKIMYSYNPAVNEWIKCGEMLETRHHHCVTFLHGSIYCIGGCDSRTTQNGTMIPVKSCFKYNIESMEWSDIPDMNNCRMYHGIGVLGNKIYVVGGKNEEDRMLDSVEYFDPAVDLWQELSSPLSVPKMGAGVCTHKDQLWVAGGMVQESSGKICVIREVECYDSIHKRWIRSRDKLPSPRCFATLIDCKDCLYLIGGTTYPDSEESDTLASMADVYWYDDDNDHWMIYTPLPYPRHLVGAVSLGGALYVLGGLATFQTSSLDDVIVHDDEMVAWNACASLPISACGFGAVSLPRRI